MLRVALVMVAAVLALGVGASVWAADGDGSEVKILSPENGAVVKGDSVELQYVLVKGTAATHVHAYVDGKYQKGFSGMLKGLTPGKHEIKVVAADPEHKVLAAESAITITVE
jgi:Family of unknown function (DUF6130)